MVLKWLGRLFGFGASGVAPVTSLAQATTQVAEVFTENKTRAMELDASAKSAALAQFAAEFSHARKGWFDRLVDGLNRLPRPLMAIGTLCLFGFAWSDPAHFVIRMEALQSVPDPLWWLLGAIVSFYFGARETHHWRNAGQSLKDWRGVVSSAAAEPAAPEPPSPQAEESAGTGEVNPALEDWRRDRVPTDGGSA